MRAITSRGLILSAFSVHDNPVHPDKAIAAGRHGFPQNRSTRPTARGAGGQYLRGCPGGSPQDVT
jgi:sugar phosphate isomerase/epimerase